MRFFLFLEIFAITIGLIVCEVKIRSKSLKSALASRVSSPSLSLNLPSINSCPSNITVIKGFEKNFLNHELGFTGSSHNSLGYIEIVYENGNNSRVLCGNKMSSRLVDHEPKIFRFHGDSDSNYTIFMVDPDYPYRWNPKLRWFLNWMIINVPGNKIWEGQVTAKYTAPFLLPRSGLHRVVFVIYKQTRKINFVNYDYDRVNFDLARFACEYGLVGPHFGNYFISEPSENINQCNLYSSGLFFS